VTDDENGEVDEDEWPDADSCEPGDTAFLTRALVDESAMCEAIRYLTDDCEWYFVRLTPRSVDWDRLEFREPQTLPNGTQLTDGDRLADQLRAAEEIEIVALFKDNGLVKVNFRTREYIAWMKSTQANRAFYHVNRLLTSGAHATPSINKLPAKLILWFPILGLVAGAVLSGFDRQHEILAWLRDRGLKDLPENVDLKPASEAIGAGLVLLLVVWVIGLIALPFVFQLRVSGGGLKIWPESASDPRRIERYWLGLFQRTRLFVTSLDFKNEFFAGLLLLVVGAIIGKVL
jgi:hypothetical protein